MGEWTWPVIIGLLLTAGGAFLAFRRNYPQPPYPIVKMRSDVLPGWRGLTILITHDRPFKITRLSSGITGPRFMLYSDAPMVDDGFGGEKIEKLGRGRKRQSVNVRSGADGKLSLKLLAHKPGWSLRGNNDAISCCCENASYPFNRTWIRIDLT